VRTALRRLGMALLAATSAGAGVCAMPAAEAAPQVWNGTYSLLRYPGEKTGTSLAARQPEPDFSDVYTFVTDCSSGTCVATVVDGPKPANPTLPLPPRYTWNGSTWVHIYEWQWTAIWARAFRRHGTRRGRSRTTRRNPTAHCAEVGAPTSPADPVPAR